MIIIYFCIFLIVLAFVFSFLSKFNDPYRDIYFVMGKPGSGKSTYFVNQMRKFIKANKRLRKRKKKEWTIYTDMSVNLPEVRIIDPQDLKKCWPEEKSVIFIDEISLLWDSRNFKSFDKGLSEFFKLHRHAECIIYCASQAFDCDLRIRQLTTHILVCNNLFGIFALVRPVIRKFPHFTEPTPDHGSDITDIYKLSFFTSWRLHFMPSSFKYFNSYIKPYRPQLPYHLAAGDLEASAEDTSLAGSANCGEALDIKI